MTFLKEKIEELKKLDKNYTVFGSEVHKYQFNPCLSESEILEFEKRHQITLPNAYRNFILEFGNGGCGPNYGLLKLETGILDIPHYPEESKRINLSNEFRFHTFWNLEDFPSEDYLKWEQEYEDSKWCDGMLRISHEGCGHFANVVISGKERGNIWIDARASDGGIYPAGFHMGKNKTDFIEWYNNWLDLAIEKIKSGKNHITPLQKNTNTTFNFSQEDIMNIKAISITKTPLWKVMRCWDVYDRGYPEYIAFINSINKLAQIEAIEINNNGRFATLSNLLYKKMTIAEIMFFLFKPQDELITKTLSKLKNSNNITLEISEQEYNEIIEEYLDKCR